MSPSVSAPYLRKTKMNLMLSRGDVLVSTRGNQYRAETVWSGKRVKGPKRDNLLEAEHDKAVIESARSTGSLEQVLADWQVNCQVLPKGVYYHREKKAYVATICITPSRYANAYSHHSNNGRNSRKYDGPARRTVDEALADREKLQAATDEDHLLEVLKELRGTSARPEKKTGHPTESVPQGVYYKPDTGTYQAQVSVNRKNIRGPPRTNLQEAVIDRQRLIIAKANNNADAECLELKLEYQRRVNQDNAGPADFVGNHLDQSLKKRGRPRGSVGGIGRRIGLADRSFDFFPGLGGGDPQAAAAAALNSFPYLLASTAAAAASAAAFQPTDGAPLPMSLLFPPTQAGQMNLMSHFLQQASMLNDEQLAKRARVDDLVAVKKD